MLILGKKYLNNMMLCKINAPVFHLLSKYSFLNILYLSPPLFGFPVNWYSAVYLLRIFVTSRNLHFFVNSPSWKRNAEERLKWKHFDNRKVDSNKLWLPKKYIKTSSIHFIDGEPSWTFVFSHCYNNIQHYQTTKVLKSLQSEIKYLKN